MKTHEKEFYPKAKTRHLQACSACGGYGHPSRTCLPKKPEIDHGKKQELALPKNDSSSTTTSPVLPSTSVGVTTQDPPLLLL